MVNGHWSLVMVNGQCSFVNCQLLMVTGHWLLVNKWPSITVHWSMVSGHVNDQWSLVLVLATGQWSMFICQLSIVNGYWSLVFGQ